MRQTKTKSISNTVNRLQSYQQFALFDEVADVIGLVELALDLVHDALRQVRRLTLRHTQRLQEDPEADLLLHVSNKEASSTVPARTFSRASQSLLRPPYHSANS